MFTLWKKMFAHNLLCHEVCSSILPQNTIRIKHKLDVVKFLSRKFYIAVESVKNLQECISKWKKKENIISVRNKLNKVNFSCYYGSNKYVFIVSQIKKKVTDRAISSEYYIMPFHGELFNINISNIFVSLDFQMKTFRLVGWL